MQEPQPTPPPAEPLEQYMERRRREAEQADREERRANRWTGFTVALTIALVVGGLITTVSWAFCLWAVLSALGVYLLSSLLGRAILYPALERMPWAVLFMRLLVPFGPVCIAVYLAGVTVLAVLGIKAAFSAAFR